MEERMIFRRVLFGGFHRSEVLDYIDNLEAEKENLKLTLQDVQEKVDEYEEKLSGIDNNYQESVSNREKELEELRKEKGQLEIQLQNAEAEKVRLLKKLKENSNNSGSSSIFDIRVSKLQAEARKIINEQKRDFEKILERLHNDMIAVIDGYKRKEAESRKKISELCVRTDEQNEIILQLSQKMEQAEQKIAEQASALEDKENILQSQMKRLEEKESKLREYEDLIESKDSELADMRKILDDVKGQLDQEEKKEKGKTFEVVETSSEPKPSEQSNISYKYVEQREKEMLQEEEPKFVAEDDEEHIFDESQNELDAIFMDVMDSINRSKEEARSRLYSL